MKDGIVIGIIITVFYVLPAIRMYWWNHVAHSKGGVWEGQPPKKTDFVVTIVPIVNIFATAISFAEHPREEKENGKETKDYSKFFRIKK